RYSFIFRYYDQDSDGTLDGQDMGQLMADLKQSDGNTQYKSKSFADFVAEVESNKLKGTSVLCRAKIPIIRMMYESNAYELIVNRQGRPFGKQMQASCVKCRPKNYSMAVHTVKLNQAGRIEDPKAEVDDSRQQSANCKLNLANDSRQPVNVRRIHSVEYLFKATASANYVLHLI